jgi:predicted nucleic acid-binding protein
VVDASALGALLFGEPEGLAVAMPLREAGLIAPALLPFEVANVCLKKMRRHPDRRDALDASYIWLARRTGAELVTLDRQSEAAATTRL